MGGAKNCPETPRQRMISMMYLVLTAMLALNVSTDILNGFKLVDQSLHSSMNATSNRNAEMYSDFKAMDDENHEKVGDWYAKALELRQQSNDLYDYIQDFKYNIAVMADGQKKVDQRVAAEGDATLNIQGNSNLDVTSTYALNYGNGAILKEKLTAYKDSVIAWGGNVEEMNKIFATNPGHNHDGEEISWEESLFEGMPVGASITILTKMQNDVRSVEGEMIQHLMGETDATDLRVNKMQAYVIPVSKYVMRGGRYSAHIVLAATDSTSVPEYYVNGTQLGDDGLYEVAAAGSGVKKFEGKIRYKAPDGSMQELDFADDYTVGEPSATLSNTELNVMYRGYDNKFSISVPGVSSDKVRVSVNGGSVSRSGNLYIIRPSEGAKEATISVQAELDGRVQSMGSQNYRIMPLPKPGAYFANGERLYDGGNVPINALKNPSNKVVASFGQDALLDLKYSIVSFKMQDQNGQLYPSSNDKFTSAQLDRIGKMKQGQPVNLVDIKAKGPDGKVVTLRNVAMTVN